MPFRGDQKTGRSVLAPLEDRFKAWLLPKVPGWLETYHLTLTTILWSVLIVVFSFLAKHDMRWLWGASAAIALQYVTDLLDGAVGRARDTGLVKWGYYMDHFLDYLFLCAILIGYSLLLPDAYKYRLFIIMAFFGAFMVNSFLSFAATNEFRISYLGIGPTEIRLVFIAVNTLLIVFGRTYMVRALPFVLAPATFGLFVTVYRTQRALWRLDMSAKHGEPTGPEPARRPDAGAFVRELSDSLSGRRVAGGLALAVLFAAAAWLVFVLRLGYPHHRSAAAGLYAAGWIPFVRSLIRRRAILRAHGRVFRRWVRPYLLHAGVGLLLIVLARATWVLVPARPSTLGAMTSGALRSQLDADLANLYVLDSNVRSLLAWAERSPLPGKPVAELVPAEKAEIRGFWSDFVAASMELEILKERYRGFYQIDYLVQPGLHADAFFVAYGAFVTQYDASAQVADAVMRTPFLATILNERNEQAGIPADSYFHMAQRLTHPDELLRLSAGAAYLLLVKKDVSRTRGLVPLVERRVKRVYKVLGSHPGQLVGAPLELLERVAFTAWFPFQKEVAMQMGDTRTSKRANFVTPALIASYRDKFMPGDLLLQRRNWYLSNVGIPGFWPHVALFIGTPNELDSYFAGLPVLRGGTACAYLKERCPAGFAGLARKSAQGADYSVLEALRDGVEFTALEVSANADYLAVLRPRVPKQAKLAALCTALGHAGKPYDYDFDFATDQALVCSELVYKAYADTPGFGFELGVVNGRLVLPPNDIAKKFDREYDTPARQLELVLFLDGNEQTGTALAREAAVFRTSWQRPKWDVLLP